MKRGILKWALGLVCAGVGISGCELFHHEQRMRAIDEPYTESEAQAPDMQVKSETGKGFFKSTRLPGAMSSEARDIERNLGVK